MGGPHNYLPSGFAINPCYLLPLKKGTCSGRGVDSSQPVTTGSSCFACVCKFLLLKLLWIWIRPCVFRIHPEFGLLGLSPSNVLWSSVPSPWPAPLFPLLAPFSTEKTFEGTVLDTSASLLSFYLCCPRATQEDGLRREAQIEAWGSALATAIPEYESAKLYRFDGPPSKLQRAMLKE